MTWTHKGVTVAAELGRDMRQDTTAALSRRRKSVGLCLAGIASLGVITLYQTGILKHLPDPHVPGFHADKVNGSAQAYRLLSVPDAVPGIGSYAVTLGLVAMGGPKRAVAHRWIPVAAGVKAGADALLSARLATDQATKYRGFSFWSLIVALTTFATLALVIPEAADAIDQLAH